MISKSIIRRSALSLRDKISVQDKSAKDARIKYSLLHLKEFKDASKVMLYASFRSEPETLTIIEEALGSGKLVALPKVEGTTLGVYEIRGMSELVSGCMGIPEPDVPQSRRIDIEQLSHFDIIVTPGVAFDASGGRLGYGCGFYDRLLGSWPLRPMSSPLPGPLIVLSRSRTLLVALAYVEQIVDDIPMQPHDVRVDRIITDDGVITPQ
ncbi:MAG: 5-formyltetrahydrofolate cyclo-ligase [Nitrospirae bacterium]|nr:5-formyltetrahydrofolate cyclo-ligase [Nitrospirota bacterium]